MVLLERGSIIARRYRLERPLARGGMGSVWVARHLQLDLDLAIKFMTPENAASADGRQRFEREARASAQLRTPNAVQVYDYGVEGDTPYIAMELLEGEDLEVRLQREGRLSLPATQVIIQQVCKALRRAHEVGFVHRDLKPANIFLAREAGEEIVKVLDFGLAKALGPIQAGKATKTGTLLGTPHYMSPEQVRRRKEIDQRSDLWSLGVIAFRCVTGQLPFPGDELGDVLVEICTDPIPFSSQIAPDLGPVLDPFFARALRREPEERFQSAQELADAFAAILGFPRALEAPAPAESALRPPAFAPAGGTLSPSGNSLRMPPRRTGTIGIVLGVLGGLVVLLIVARTVLRDPDPNAASPPPPAPSATSAPAASDSAAAEPPAPSAKAAASAPATPSAAASARAKPASPPKGVPRRTTPGKSGRDPLDSM